METARRNASSEKQGRKGESTWFRSDRVFGAGDQWYFHTREGIDIGPYDTRFEAEIEAGMLREMLLGVEPSETLGVIREFVLDSFAMGRPLMPHYREVPLAS